MYLLKLAADGKCDLSYIFVSGSEDPAGILIAETALWLDD